VYDVIEVYEVIEVYDVSAFIFCCLNVGYSLLTNYTNSEGLIE
jgi:hypothetical protein